jgi:hypothetical protein
MCCFIERGGSTLHRAGKELTALIGFSMCLKDSILHVGGMEYHQVCLKTASWDSLTSILKEGQSTALRDFVNASPCTAVLILRLRALSVGFPMATEFRIVYC